MLAGQMTSLKSEVVQLGAQVQHHEQRMSDVERQLRETTAGSCPGSGAASSAAASEPRTEPARGSGAHRPLNINKTLLVVGGFTCDSEREVTCEKLRVIFGQEPGVSVWWTPGKVGSVGKVNFHTNDHAWTFLRKYKGRKFSHGSKQLWHAWDRPKDVVLLSKKGISGDQGAAHPCCGGHMEQRWASTEIGSVIVCGSRNYARRSVRLPSTAAQTAHPLNWRTQEKLCQDGMRTSRLCGNEANLQE